MKVDRSLGVLNISKKSFVLVEPKAGMYWTPSPVLSSVEKEGLEAQASAMIARGDTSVSLTGPGSQEGGGSGWLLSVALSLPRSTARALRWSLRSRARTAGMLGTVLIGYLILDWVGLFAQAQSVIEAVGNWLRTTARSYSETSEWAFDLYTRFETWAESWQSVLPSFSRGVMIALALAGLSWGVLAEHLRASEPSPASSGTVTPSTPGVLTPPDPHQASLAAMLAAQQLQQQEFQKGLLDALGKFAERDSGRSSVKGTCAQASQSSDPHCSSQAKEASTGPVQPQPGAKEAQKPSSELQEMKQRLDLFEQLIRADSQKSQPGRGGTMVDLPRGTPESGELTVEQATAGSNKASGVNNEVDKIISQLLMKAQDAHSLAVSELQRYKDIPEEDWPLPSGYRARLAPAYFAHIYGSQAKAKNYGEKFLRDHGLEDCYAARRIVTNLENVDTMLIVERQEGFINYPSFEILCRETYGLEEAFRRCRTKKDWCRMDGQKNFKSKVDWEACRRIDPNAISHQKLRMKNVEEEINKERERDALIAKTRQKLQEYDKEENLDPLNP